MRIHRPVIVVALIATLGAVLAARQGHVMSTMAESKWGPAPPFIPAGAEIAVMSGDPGKSGPYTVRLKFPANYAVGAHSHPTDENVAVTSGALFMGMGNKLDKTMGHALGVGGYALMPAGMNHFAYTQASTTILLYGQGPVDFKYVNPADDPRNAKK